MEKIEEKNFIKIKEIIENYLEDKFDTFILSDIKKKINILAVN
jgi:hypothetical protein